MAAWAALALEHRLARLDLVGFAGERIVDRRERRGRLDLDRRFSVTGDFGSSAEGLLAGSERDG
ncbi:hypothetical protein [Methylocella sp.]|uniref:hypothetical protein n=1 Tax=Methylocella sp. TaxID=1978226 RepID=UPI0035B1DBC8